MNEEFEKWYSEYSKYWGDSTKRDVQDCIDVIQAAYKAGAAAMKEWCARICQEKADEVRAEGITTQELGFMVLDYEECAAAIRGQR